MRSDSGKYILLGYALFFLGTGFAQNIQWEHIQQMEILNVDLIGTDGRGHIFVSDTGGIVHQFDRNGNPVNVYSPPFTSRLDKLECHWTVNIFLFSADLQRYELLDRFLNPITSQQIPSGSTGIIKAATLGNNNMLWLIDETEMSLKKLDYRRNQIIEEQPLGLILPESSLEVVDISERKNMVFIQIKDEGVYIFDNQGNFIKKTKTLPATRKVIEENYIYGIEQGHIYKTDYLTDATSKIKLPNPSYHSMALSKDHVILVKKNKIDIFKRPFGL